MNRQHTSYHNLRTWKVVNSRTAFAIVPSPNSVLWNFAVCVPLFAFFLWLLHSLAIHNQAVLLLTVAIVLATSIALLAICLTVRSRSPSDKTPLLEILKAQGTLRLPRAKLEFPLVDENYFIAYDHFTDGCESFASELNMIRQVRGEEQLIPLLHSSDRAFDKICSELLALGVHVKFRKHAA